MTVELTGQQRKLVDQCSGQPIELVDPQTHQIYVLIAREQFEQMKPLHKETPPPPTFEIPEGIRRSQTAMRRELPKLLENKKLRGQWVAYHGEERVGLRSQTILIEACIKCGYESREYYVAWVNPCESFEEEELETRPWHSDNDELSCGQ